MKYYKLGKKAKSFADSSQKMTVSPARPGMAGTVSTLIANAVANGHLVEITKEEYETRIADYEKKSSRSQAPEPRAIVEKEKEHKKEPTEEELFAAEERTNLLKRVDEFDWKEDKKGRKAFEKMTNEQIAQWLKENEEE